MKGVYRVEMAKKYAAISKAILCYANILIRLTSELTNLIPSHDTVNRFMGMTKVSSLMKGVRFS